MTTSFNLKINGKTRFFKTTISTLKELEIALKINLSHKILEINGIIIDKKNHSSVTLKNGDSIEIIQFMGGG